MVDKSWGGDPSATFRIRTNDTLSERAEARAKAREARVAERAASFDARLKDRAIAREAEIAAREAARTERREREMRAAAEDPHSREAQRPRGSGRKDIVREERDTSGYAVVVNEGRIRELAKRGATVAGLAVAFKLGEAEVQTVLDAAAD